MEREKAAAASAATEEGEHERGRPPDNCGSATLDQDIPRQHPGGQDKQGCGGREAQENPVKHRGRPFDRDQDDVEGRGHGERSYQQQQQLQLQSPVESGGISNTENNSNNNSKKKNKNKTKKKDKNKNLDINNDSKNNNNNNNNKGNNNSSSNNKNNNKNKSNNNDKSNGSNNNNGDPGGLVKSLGREEDHRQSRTLDEDRFAQRQQQQQQQSAQRSAGTQPAQHQPGGRMRDGSFAGKVDGGAGQPHGAASELCIPAVADSVPVGAPVGFVTRKADSVPAIGAPVGFIARKVDLCEPGGYPVIPSGMGRRNNHVNNRSARVQQNSSGFVDNSHTLAKNKKIDLKMVSEAGHDVAGMGAAVTAAAEGRNSSASPAAGHGPSERHGNHGDEAIGDSKAGKRKRQHTHPDDQEARCPVLRRKVDGVSWTNTYRQPREATKSSSVQGLVEPTAVLKAAESVCTGDEQSAASRSHGTVAVVAPPPTSPVPPSLQSAAAGGARMRGEDRSPTSAKTAERTVANLASSSSSSPPAVSIAGGEPTARLPAPAAREESRRASSPSSLPAVSASGGESQRQFRPEAVSPAAAAGDAAGDAAAAVRDAAAVRANSPSSAPPTATAATAVCVERTAATPASASASAAAAAAADPTSRWLRVRFRRTELGKMSRFVQFFNSVFGEHVIVTIDETESFVKILWVAGQTIADSVACYLEHAMQVCQEGPWQPTDFSLVQVRIPTHGEDSRTSRFLLSVVYTSHPSTKKLQELSTVYGIVGANVNTNCLRTQPPSSDDGLPRSFAPPNVEAADEMVAQLWGLNHGVQAALDCLVVCPCNKRKSLWLGQRRMRQLQNSGWLRTVKGTKVVLHQRSGTIIATLLPSIASSLANALPRSVQLVDMIDAAAMRNLATPAQLEAFAQAGGGAAGEIKVIPVWETSSALVLALGEETSESAVGKVRNAISEAVRHWAATNVSVPLKANAAHTRQTVSWKNGSAKDFKPPLVADLSHAVSAYGVNLWLDGCCLRARVEDVGIKAAVEAVLFTEITQQAVEAVLDTKIKQKYLDVLAGATAVADRPSPAAVTTAAAGLPILALPPSEASGPGASNPLSTPEAVANAGSERAPFDVAPGGGGDGGEAGGCSGVWLGLGTKAGAAAAPAPAAAPGTAWSGERASAVTTVPANRFSVGEGAVSEQGARSARPTAAAAAVTRGEIAPAGSAATTFRVGSGGHGSVGCGDGVGAGALPSFASKTASGPPASARGSGSLNRFGTAYVSSPATTGGFGAPPLAAVGPKTLAPTSADLSARTGDGAAATTPSASTAAAIATPPSAAPVTAASGTAASRTAASVTPAAAAAAAPAAPAAPASATAPATKGGGCSDGTRAPSDGSTPAAPADGSLLGVG